VEGNYMLMVRTLQQFFAFEIEETDVRRVLSPFVANVDHMIPPTPKAMMCQRDPFVTPSRILPPAEPIRQEPSTQSTIPPPSDENIVFEQLVLPRLNAQGVSSMQYRIRGSGGSKENEGVEAETRGFQRVIHDQFDEEQRLLQSLQEARRRMRKHMQLQVWRGYYGFI